MCVLNENEDRYAELHVTFLIKYIFFTAADPSIQILQRICRYN
jgi:hypothetical protein